MELNEPPIFPEIEERVEQISSAVASLRQVLGQGKTERQLLDHVFRQVHSLKATAAAHQLTDITTLAHELENLLHALRTGRVSLNMRILERLDQTVDVLFAQLDTSQSSSPEVSTLIAQLQRLAAGEKHRPLAEVEIILSILPAELWQSLNEEEKHKLHASVTEGANLFLVSTDFDLGNFDQAFQSLKEKLSVKGEVISTAPIVQRDRPEKIDFRILYTSLASRNEVCSNLETISGVCVSSLDANSETTASAESKQLDLSSVETEQREYVRVDLEDLDRITSSAYSLSHQIESLIANNPDLESAGAKVRECSLDLAKAIVGVRMVPIRRMLQRVVRTGRTATRLCNKEVEFQTLGEDLLMDQTLCDALADPLVHLVRNAVDHGIELPADRIRHGKSARGIIRISASSGHAQTRITVSDDGRGLDPEAIAEASVRLGLTTRLPLSLDETVRMIFRPGFSTASTVTETSGRGVGLDVVETRIERLGGQIRVSSKPNAGATFEIRLPVTFGLLEVISVRVGKWQYLIDASQVISVELAGNGVGIVKLSDILGTAAAGDGPGVRIVCQLNHDANKHVSVLVDETVGRQQVVIRSLGSHASRWFGVAGATELRDGTVALLLDLVRLIKL